MTDTESFSRRDDCASQRISSVLFDLVSKDNNRARTITRFVDTQERTRRAGRIKGFRRKDTLFATGTLRDSLLQEDENIVDQTTHRWRSSEFSELAILVLVSRRNALLPQQ